MSLYPNSIPRCQHLKVNGTQCGSPALRRNRLCYFHKSWQQTRIVLNANRARRGRAALDLPVLEDANSIQVSLMQVMRLILSGQVDPKTAGLLLYALQTASSNLSRINFEPAVKTRVVIDPRTVDQTPLGEDPWCREDFEEEEYEEDEQEENEQAEAAAPEDSGEDGETIAQIEGVAAIATRPRRNSSIRLEEFTRVPATHRISAKGFRFLVHCDSLAETGNVEKHDVEGERQNSRYLRPIVGSMKVCAHYAWRWCPIRRESFHGVGVSGGHGLRKEPGRRVWAEPPAVRKYS
jgi:hypothetical protein